MIQEMAQVAPRARESLVEYLEPEVVEEDTAPPKRGKKTQLQDVLNAILPPHEFIANDGARLRQQVFACLVLWVGVGGNGSEKKKRLRD